MSKSHTRNLTNIIIDSIMFGIFIVTTAPQFTGISLHEWLGLILTGITVIHLIRNWEWLVATVNKLLSPSRIQNKASIILNIVLFVLVTLVTYSGIAISEDVMPWLGITWFVNNDWRMLHNLFSNLTVVALAAHIALHWNWIVSLFQKGRRPASPTKAEVR
jgi:cytochrome b561